MKLLLVVLPHSPVLLNFNSGFSVGSGTPLFASGFNVSDTATFSVTVDINAGLDVDGQTDLDELVVAGVSTFNNDVNFVGDSANIVFDKSQDRLEFATNAAAVFGSGDDLKIYHNSHSYIDQTGSNNLHIRNNVTDDQDVTIQTDDGSGGAAIYFSSRRC